jgi:hypothetical protein
MPTLTVGYGWPPARKVKRTLTETDELMCTGGEAARSFARQSVAADYAMAEESLEQARLSFRARRAAVCRRPDWSARVAANSAREAKAVVRSRRSHAHSARRHCRAPPRCRRFDHPGAWIVSAEFGPVMRRCSRVPKSVLGGRKTRPVCDRRPRGRSDSPDAAPVCKRRHRTRAYVLRGNFAI